MGPDYIKHVINLSKNLSKISPNLGPGQNKSIILFVEQPCVARAVLQTALSFIPLVVKENIWKDDDNNS